MRRRLLNSLTALSLLLCTAVLALWVRGYSRAEFFRWCTVRTELSVESSRGKVAFCWNWINPRRGTFYAGFFHSVSEPFGLEAWRSSWGARGWSFGSFSWYAHGDVADDTPFVTRVIQLPTWSLAALLGVLPAFRGWLWTRRHSPATGLCARCGYDLIPSPRPVIAILPDEPLPRRQPTPRP